MNLQDNLQGRVYPRPVAERVVEQLRAEYADSPYDFQVEEQANFARIEVSAGCTTLGYY